jgi:hypothetical protein
VVPGPLCKGHTKHRLLWKHEAQVMQKHRLPLHEVWFCVYDQFAQVMSRFKLPPLLDLEGSDYQQMQAALMAMGEPST